MDLVTLHIDDTEVQAPSGTTVLEAAAYLVEHGIAHKRNVSLPRIWSFSAAPWVKAIRVCTEGKIENMFEARLAQAFNIVCIPCEQGRPGADAA